MLLLLLVHAESLRHRPCFFPFTTARFGSLVSGLSFRSRRAAPRNTKYGQTGERTEAGIGVVDSSRLWPCTSRDDVSLKILLPVTVDGVNVLPTGWPVHGRVGGVSRASGNCKPGNVVWKLNEITAPDGTKITISTESTEKKTDKQVKKAVKYTALAPLAAIASPYLGVLWLGMHNEGRCRGAVGEEERLPAGTALSAEVSKDTVLLRIP